MSVKVTQNIIIKKKNRFVFVATSWQTFIILMYYPQGRFMMRSIVDSYILSRMQQ